MQKRQASKFYPHFNQEERPVIDYFTGLFNQIIFKHEPILTDFLDPGKRAILKTIVGNDVFMQEYGGYSNAEKKRVYLSEEWVNLQPSDYLIQPYEIEYPQKFIKINHSAILGTLANSGIETDTFGDIITDENGKWQFFAKKELVDFFEEQVTRIGRADVK
uniref:YlmH/Sll1252 family protein n=1 Tax=uncultured Lactobacillus sp. TaxID=153152 RepID=UPI002804C016